MANESQMLKGLLEGCILELVNQEETYGYELCERLAAFGFDGISEGSVYPILIRLEKKEWISSILRESPFGPMRKYYRLTNQGRYELSEFIASWKRISKSIDKVLGGNGNG